MKFLLASDIHGSAEWCAKLMREIEREAPDKVLLLGDLLYHGPRNSLPENYETMEVANMLNAVKDRIIAVRGNCDSEVDQMVLDFPCTADYAQVFGAFERDCASGSSAQDADAGTSRGMRDTGAGTLIYCTHGHLHSPDDLPDIPAGSIFASGHTHVQMLDEKWGVRIVNPGSVGLPRDGIHGYAIIEGGEIELQSLN